MSPRLTADTPASRLGACPEWSPNPELNRAMPITKRQSHHWAGAWSRPRGSNPLPPGYEPGAHPNVLHRDGRRTRRSAGAASSPKMNPSLTRHHPVARTRFLTPSGSEGGVVHVAGFEPATFGVSCRCSTGLSHTCMHPGRVPQQGRFPGLDLDHGGPPRGWSRTVAAGAASPSQGGEAANRMLVGMEGIEPSTAPLSAGCTHRPCYMP